MQYTCYAYKANTNNIIRSYFKQVCLLDNACIESFYALIKNEKINCFKILDYRYAEKLVFEYIYKLFIMCLATFYVAKQKI